MPVLAIDTSDAVGVAVLGDDGSVLAVRDVSQARRHAELLAPMIAEALAEAQVRPQELTYVAVGTGPAPFTGLRVGLVSAQTFAFAAGIPVYGVSTLDAVAQHTAAQRQLPQGTTVLVAMDAKRREVYYARYVVSARQKGSADHEGLAPSEGSAPDDGSVPAVDVVVAPDVASAQDVVAAGHATGAVVVGAGAQLYRSVFEPVAAQLVAQDGPANPAAIAVAVGQLARQGLEAGVDLPVRPLYLRRPDAQEPAARKRAS